MIEIEQNLWSMTPEGEAIILYTMSNSRGGRVRVTNYGAAIVSIEVPDREGHIDDVALGYKHPRATSTTARRWARAWAAWPTGLPTDG